MSENSWSIIQEAFNAFAPHYQDEIRPAMEQVGFEGPDWFFTYLVYGSDSETTTATAVHEMLAYISLERIQERLALVAEHGFLKNIGDNSYTITSKGQDGIDLFFKSARVAIGNVTPMSEAKMERLADLLEKVVNASANASEPAAKPNLLVSRSTAPGPDENAAIQIDQYLTDLLRYRDDAHIAAWKPHEISGQAWEAFSLIWQGDVNTLAELVENRQNRGFDEAAYANALNDLVKRGWLSESDDAYQVTDKGKQVREQAEEQTNAYFFVGLQSLSEAENEKLTKLLVELKEGLAIPEPEEEPVPA